jgi:hypothetical protein
MPHFFVLGKLQLEMNGSTVPREISPSKAPWMTHHQSLRLLSCHGNLQSEEQIEAALFLNLPQRDLSGGRRLAYRRDCVPQKVAASSRHVLGRSVGFQVFERGYARPRAKISLLHMNEGPSRSKLVIICNSHVDVGATTDSLSFSVSQ